MEGIPVYSEDALAVRDVFSTAVKGIHFFVEDEGQENLYAEIISRALPRVSAFSVFGLGGKSNVIRHLDANHPVPAGVARVYILDRDFDDLLGKMVNARGVFYLDDYCIETSILDGASMLRMCVEERPRNRIADICEQFNYEREVGGWMPLLLSLHKLYVVAQKYSLNVRSTDRSIEEFTAQGRAYSICEKAVAAYGDQVYEAMVEQGCVKGRDNFDAIVDSVFEGEVDLLARLNGKYIFSLIYHRLRYLNLVGAVRRDSMIFRCVAHSGMGRLAGVSEKIIAYVSEVQPEVLVS